MTIVTDAFYELRAMMTDAEIQDLDQWEPSTVLAEEVADQSDDTKADDQ